ncbi:S1 family peptidase [Teichococcus rhizosphaerae]|nr:serine protease [Pseudoroseomonas rhizosphaerae]
MTRWKLAALVGMAAAGLATILGGGSLGEVARPAAAAMPGGGAVTGSAFLVAPGLLVTNVHVVLHCRAQGRPVQVAGLAGPWRVLAEEGSSDLVLLSGPPSGEAFLSLSTAQRLPRDMPVLALGYPARAARAGQMEAAPGRIRRAALTVHDPEGGHAPSFVMTDRQGREVEARWEDGIRYFGSEKAGRLRWRLEIDAATGGGNSGGPVLDAAGNVVGVVYAGGQGSTAAVPLADLRELLARAGVAPRLRTPAGLAAPDWSAVRARAAPAVRRLFC